MGIGQGIDSSDNRFKKMSNTCGLIALKDSGISGLINHFPQTLEQVQRSRISKLHF